MNSEGDPLFPQIALAIGVFFKYRGEGPQISWIRFGWGAVGQAVVQGVV